MEKWLRFHFTSTRTHTHSCFRLWNFCNFQPQTNWVVRRGFFLLLGWGNCVSCCWSKDAEIDFGLELSSGWNENQSDLKHQILMKVRKWLICQIIAIRFCKQIFNAIFFMTLENAFAMMKVILFRFWLSSYGKVNNLSNRDNSVHIPSGSNSANTTLPLRKRRGQVDV